MEYSEETWRFRDTKAEEIFRVIESLREELARLRQVERDYLKLQEELKSLLAKAEQDRLATAPRGGVFYFSLDVGRYTSYSASNLEEFSRVLQIVPAQSLEFHLYRGDFEVWLESVGSEELALAFRSLRNENLYGEALRNRLLDVIQSASSPEGETIENQSDNVGNLVP